MSNVETKEATETSAKTLKTYNEMDFDEQTAYDKLPADKRAEYDKAVEAQRSEEAVEKGKAVIEGALAGKERFKATSDMLPGELAAYEALSETQQKLYDKKLALQGVEDAKEALRLAREEETQAREARKAAKEKETKIKAIISDVRKDELPLNQEKPLAENPELHTRIKALGELSEEEKEQIFKRIKTDAVAQTSRRVLPVKPAYELSYALEMVKKEDLITPKDGGRADITLTNNLRVFPVVSPILVHPANEEGKYAILDGKRRYWLYEDGATLPVIVVSGFPDEQTRDKAEVVVNRVRNLNILATAEAFTKLKTQGVEDSEIRRSMGFKSGEISRITSITTLGDDLQEAIANGAITPNVALEIAKLPKNLRRELASNYKAALKEDENARISEAHVDKMKQKRAEEAVKRDTPLLAAEATATPDLDNAKAEEVSSKADPKTKKAKTSKAKK